MSRDATPSHLYLQLFPRDGADAIGRIIEIVRLRKERFIREWLSLCAASLKGRGTLPAHLFQDTYIPLLRGAMEALARGDAGTFVVIGRGLGERLAQDHVPFAAMVAHLNLLKESCAKIIGEDDPEQVNRALLLLDKLSACLVSASAETYYDHTRRTHTNGHTDPALEPACEQKPSCAPSGFFQGIVGRSQLMQRVFEQIRRVASGSAPVLVLGETGTGKELVARAIHQSGPRRGGPFIALNCAALPRELIESELFGYKRGAFSGAVNECLGLFRAAAGGTLLLDEITEMGPDLQAKLLRVLQERTVRPVGSVNEERIDVRIIASSNRDPELALRSGLLRLDLYYRLSVSTLVLPPLRERIEDITPLVEYCLASLNERYAETLAGRRGVTPDAMRRLMARPWPGNVRELFNVVENAFTMCTSPDIGVSHLGLAEHDAEPATVSATSDALTTFEESERVLIERTLASTGGNKLRAAQRLGISRKRLYSKIARYGLSSGGGQVGSPPNGHTH